MISSILLSLLTAQVAHADAPVRERYQITGQLGVGTKLPQARLDLQMDQNDRYGLRVSAADGRPLFMVGPDARAAIGLNLSSARESARLDLHGSVLLRAGSSDDEAQDNQVAFAAVRGQSSQFSIRSRHSRDGKSENAIDIYAFGARTDWQRGRGLRVLSVESGPSRRCGVSISASGTRRTSFALEVSSGSVPGSGAIRYGSSAMPDPRSAWVSPNYVDDGRAVAAYKTIMELKHVEANYIGSEQVGVPGMRGVLYDDAPESIRGPDRSVVVDARVAELELALKAIRSKIAALENAISVAEKRR
jgi:hypothetical protein